MLQILHVNVTQPQHSYVKVALCLHCSDTVQCFSSWASTAGKWQLTWCSSDESVYYRGCGRIKTARVNMLAVTQCCYSHSSRPGLRVERGAALCSLRIHIHLGKTWMRTAALKCVPPLSVKFKWEKYSNVKTQGEKNAMLQNNSTVWNIH